MAIDVVMPRLSDTMEEGTVVKWLKSVGESVAVGDVLAEVETDKATMELEAFDAGTLSEIRVAEGEAAPVGAVIAVLGAAGEASAPQKPAGRPAASAPEPASPPARPAPPAASAPPARSPAAPPAAPAPAAPPPAAPPARSEPASPPPAAGGRLRVSPRARRLAGERGIDLAAVRGSGPGGRVLEGDLDVAPVTEAAPSPTAAAPGGQRVALGKIRRTTAARMAAAKRDVPHFYASSDIEVEALGRLKDELRQRGGDWQRVTVTHLLLKAVGLALHDVPEMNASWAEDAVMLHPAVNLGLAVATDDGLVVPVVHACDTRPLAEIVRQAQALVERARAGRFAGGDLLGATFTISNLGMYPVSHFAAVVNPPHAGILAVGAVRAVPVVRGQRVVPGQVMSVTLSCDHRVVDGVVAGRFLQALKPRLEEPQGLLD